jgi:ABC-type antimicrobial peptide transport system permease subunit
MKYVRHGFQQNFIMVKQLKHEKNITRLWFKIMPNIGVEWIEGNRLSGLKWT